MPVYTFEDPSTGKVISVLVRLDEPDEARHVQVHDGVEYKRVYSSPGTSIDTRTVDASKDEFTKMTNKNGITVGEMWEISAEMSAHRAEKKGKDPVQESFYRHHEREYGEKHAEEKKSIAREQAMESARKFGVTLED